MTCIIGLVTETGDVYIGGDSAITWGSNICRVDNDCKVFRNGPFLIGCAGDMRYMNALRCSFKPPVQPPEQDTYEYMCASFVDAMRQCLKDAGQAKVESNAETTGSWCLVGYRGRLFSVAADYAVVESQDPDHLETIGNGGAYAQGAATALAAWAPEERLLRALEIAEQFCTGVRAPFSVRRLPLDGGDER